MRDVLETVDEFVAASMELVAWELSASEDTVRPMWELALTRGWLTLVGPDEFGELASTLTAHGERELRRMQLTDAAAICCVCGRVCRADGVCGRCGIADSRPAEGYSLLERSGDERLLLVVGETCAAYDAARTGQPPADTRSLRERLETQAQLLRVRAEAITSADAAAMRAWLGRVEDCLSTT